MESFSLLPSKPVFLHSRGLLGQSQGNISTSRTRQYVTKSYTLSLRPSGTFMRQYKEFCVGLTKLSKAYLEIDKHIKLI